ncbi:Vesicle-associated protein 1-1 [Zea mays]|uniref:Vesicle-associated protein 1-1 n=2 Tax=Zea mays TaxID=4577 RepID=A0A1D6JAZ5_MAIZE|nr:Vesicle-associated protein 1-1 [Zea mays]
MWSHSKDLLEIEPLELRFPFETKKQISCSMQLTNRTDDYIGFKVKTTSPKKYCVRPNSGIVPPRSTSDVIGNSNRPTLTSFPPSSFDMGVPKITIIQMPDALCNFSVTMQAQKEAPPDMQCKDKFLVQSVVVAEGTLVKDITGDMFTKESANVVDEVKLKVVYIPPPKPPSPVHEESEEGSSPRPSLSDGINLNYQEMQTTRESDESLLFSAVKTHIDQKDYTSETSALISKLTEERNSAIQQNNKLREELDLTRREANKQNGGFSFVVVVAIALLGMLLGYIMKR